MYRTRRTKRAFKQVYATLFVVGLVCYFAYHAINGERGILAFFKLNHQLDASENHLEQLRLERLNLEHTVSLLRPNSLDLDLLDEQARKILGYAGGDEKVYIVDNKNR
jgi:cell division protein FtsB